MALYGAGPAEVGGALAAYNASGFAASFVVPAHADRRRDYLRPMLACALLATALAVVLAVTTSLPVVVAALVVLGGPAGVGTTLLFAHLRHSGAPASEVVRTRAVVSLAWVVGPPLATALLGWSGERALLVALAAVALLSTATAAAMVADHPAEAGAAAAGAHEDGPPAPRTVVTLVVLAFVVLQATNHAAVSVMALFVPQALGADVAWAGVVLGVAAALEVPALLLVGRLSQRRSLLALVASGCVAGALYYTAAALVGGPVALLALQVLNAWFFAVVAGAGLALFQDLIPRPGLASGLYANTRRLGAIASGPLIALAASTDRGYASVFTTSAVMTVLALVLVALAARTARTARHQEP